MKLRPFREADRPSLLSIWKRSVRSSHDFLSDADLEGIESEVRAYLTVVSSDFWIVESPDGEPVGFMGLTGSSIDTLFIVPEAQGRGAGRMCVEHARSRSPHLTVDVNEQNQFGIAFYQHCGFEIVGRSETDSSGRPFPLLHLATSTPENAPSASDPHEPAAVELASDQRPGPGAAKLARRWNPFRWLRALFAVLGLWLGIALVLDKQSSESGLWMLTTVFVMLGLPIVVLMLLVTWQWRILLDIILAPALLAFLGFHAFHWVYWPSNLRVGFGSPPGASGSYHVAQFYHKVGAEWIEGPMVEGWPMRVSFPDLNSDGHKDIRVIEETGNRGDAIEFVFVPDGKDGIFWRPHRMESRLSVWYGASRFSLNYP